MDCLGRFRPFSAEFSARRRGALADAQAACDRAGAWEQAGAPLARHERGEPPEEAKPPQQRAVP